MKKSLFIIMLLLILSATNVFGQSVVSINVLSEGILSVHNGNINEKAVRLMVEKDQVQYQYNINGSDIKVPLQMGNGTYQISVLENVEGNRFKVVSKDTVNVSLKDDKSVFLGSIQQINWDPSMKSIMKAQNLVKGLNNDEAKVKAIYDYVTKNVVYDYNKISSLRADYLPEIDKVFEGNKGICYDYSSLFAGMLRSVGVPTKLVMGYAPNVKEYHAWNEVYINGKWVAIDTTTDAVYVQKNAKTSMIKDKSLFNVMKVY